MLSNVGNYQLLKHSLKSAGNSFILIGASIACELCSIFNWLHGDVAMTIEYPTSSS